MPVGEMIGWLAAGLTLLAFSLRSIFALRIAAMGANVCFITYATLTGISPVLALHMLLLPCNVLRLRQLTAMAAARQPKRPHVPVRATLGGDRDWLIVTREYRHANPVTRIAAPTGRVIAPPLVMARLDRATQ